MSSTNTGVNGDFKNSLTSKSNHFDAIEESETLLDTSAIFEGGDKSKPKEFIIKKFQRIPSNAHITGAANNKLQNINIHNINSSSQYEDCYS